LEILLLSNFSRAEIIVSKIKIGNTTIWAYFPFGAPMAQKVYLKNDVSKKLPTKTSQKNESVKISNTCDTCSQRGGPCSNTPFVAQDSPLAQSDKMWGN